MDQLWRSRSHIILALLPLFLGLPLAKPSPSVVQGIITDDSGARVPRARVQISRQGFARTVSSDRWGRFVIQNLEPGHYVIEVSALGFATSSQEIKLGGGVIKTVDLKLEIPPSREEITVTQDAPSDRLTSQPTLVLSGPDLENLPGGPGGLMATLRAFAPFAGPIGPRLLVNGFPTTRLPERHVISEIRIDENPFSAEYGVLGEGQVRIFTKPGTDQFHGGAYSSFGDQRFNSRNPFAPERALYQYRLFSGSLSGPLIPSRASFFVDYERRETDDSSLVNATILDGDLNPLPFNESVLKPELFSSLLTRLDTRINTTNSLTANYIRTRRDVSNEDVGYFSLPSRASQSAFGEDTFQLTERWFLSPGTLNETRFEYSHSNLTRNRLSPAPTIRVAGAFTGGGSGSSTSQNERDHWEVDNVSLLNRSNHEFKIGGELRSVLEKDVSTANFFGTFTFTGGLAPLLDENGQVVLETDGEPVVDTITSLERYRRTLLFQGRGLSPEEIELRGGGASQLSIVGGDPRTRVRQYEYGGFFQDDWRLRRNFTLSWGLRFEGQTHVSGIDFAPRIGLAWAPGGSASGKRPETVVRAGFGIFYERFNERFTLRADRLDGITQREYIVSDPEILGSFPAVPLPSDLDRFAVSPTRVRVADDLRTPYTMQSIVSLERRLPWRLVLSTAFAHTRTVHALRSRNINAPIPTGDDSAVALPRPDLGPVYQYESSGLFKQNQWTLSLIDRSRKRMSWYATYILTKTSTDTDGAESFPSDPSNLNLDFGRSSLEARHTFYFGAWIRAPWGVMLTPLVVARSGLPFDITTGRDSNGDSLFTERPAFATDLTAPSVVSTPFGVFDLNPAPGQEIVPRNLGESPGFFTVNLRVAKSLAFGEPGENSNQSGRRGRRFQLIFSTDIENIFNRVNAGSRVGNLDSPFFGISTGSAGAFGFGNNPAGNRTINFRVHLRF